MTEKARRETGREARSERPAAAPAGDAVLVTDPAGRIVSCDGTLERMLGVSVEALVGRGLRELLPPRPGPQPPGHYVSETRGADGRPLTLAVSLHACSSEPRMQLAIVRDAGAQEYQAAELLRLATAVEQTGDAVLITDSRGFVEYVNPSFEQITGYGRDEVLGLGAGFLKSGRHDRAFYDSLWRTIESGEVFRATFANRKKDGEIFFEEKTISPIRDREGRITHYVSTAKDVTRRVQAEERLALLANYDGLTGLPNRNLLMDRLAQAIARTQRRRGHLAVLYLDVDRFKTVNDSLGHASGDALLKEVAHRLRQCIREEDTLARLGGDDFVILLETLRRPEHSVRILEKIYEAFRQPLAIEGRALHVSPSIGVSLHPRDGADAQALLMQADIAMYCAKESGKNCYRFYQPRMARRVQDLFHLETDLRQALERKEFWLAYQPQIDLATGRMTGAEALLRWARPDQVPLPPAQFIPVLEDTRLIDPVGRWIVQTACEGWQAVRHAAAAPPTLALNFSSRQFQDPYLANFLEQTLDRLGLPASLLEIEITEGTLMESTPSTVHNLDAIADLGIGIAVDDFGTGYSALSYLKRFKVNRIKIDRSFVWDAPHDADAAALVKAILSLARSLGIDVVAEGVETEAQLDFLRAHGCTTVQGYLTGRPDSFEALVRRLREDASPAPQRLQ